MPDFDVAAAHRFFSVECFNNAWELMEKQDRTPADDGLLEATGHASLFHWLARPDCTDRNLSIGHWQLSRIYAVLRNAPESRRHAEACLASSGSLEPFFVGYGYEAAARAAKVAGESAESARFAVLAREQALLVERDEDRVALLQDIDSISVMAPPQSN